MFKRNLFKDFLNLYTYVKQNCYHNTLLKFLVSSAQSTSECDPVPARSVSPCISVQRGATKSGAAGEGNSRRRITVTFSLPFRFWTVTQFTNVLAVPVQSCHHTSLLPRQDTAQQARTKEGEITITNNVKAVVCLRSMLYSRHKIKILIQNYICN